MLLHDLIQIFFPSTCCCCGRILVGSEHHICIHCLFHLPTTEFCDFDNNPVENLFLGRIPYQAATSYLYFSHYNITRSLLHAIKYRNNLHLARIMGRQIGLALAKSHRFSTIDTIVPIPLHKAKQRRRGYNQSQEICYGIAETFPCNISVGNLVRTINTDTQTNKDRLHRLDNMTDAFALHNPQLFEGKHLLLVDDMLTTGATIESASITLYSVPNIHLSIATLAVGGGY